MPLVATRADALRMEDSGTEVVHLNAVGTIPGVVLLAVAARNGLGTGTIRSEGEGNTLSWRAPGSETFGDSVTVAADGDVLLEDGEDTDKWVRIEIHFAELAPGSASEGVLLDDVYNNAIAAVDVNASRASSGDVAIYTVTMSNDGSFTLENLDVWIDSAVSGIEISDDGIVWVSPTTEGTALSFPDLIATGSDTLHIRRTIGAASPSDAAVVDLLHLAYNELTDRRFHDARGVYRVFNVTELRFYRSNTAPPEESDSPFDTNATLPYTPDDLYADGTWFLSMSRFNGVIDSGFLPLGPNDETYLRLDIDGGVVIDSPPNAPIAFNLELTTDNKCRVTAFYNQTGDLRATEWALTFETDGSTPGEPPAVEPDELVAIPASGFAAFDFTIDTGGQWKVRLQTRRTGPDSYSEGSEVLELDVILASGDPGPQRVAAWPGRLPERV